MRQHHYNFAHRVLPSDAANPALWNIISSDRAASYLDMRWSDAAAGPPEPSKGLIWIEAVTLSGIEIRTIRMPPPTAMAETHYAAMARTPDGTVRYFVAEQGEGRVYMAEWRHGMRVRYDTLAEQATGDELRRYLDLPSNAAPWEVSASSIGGLPYLPAFLTAIVAEMGNADANAQAKEGMQAAPASAPAKAKSNTMFVVITLLAGLAAVLIAAAV